MRRLATWNDRTRIIDALGWFELRDTSRMFAEQIAREETRADAWPVLRDRAATLVPRMRDDEAQRMIGTIGRACDRRIADEARGTLGPLMEKIDGGPFAFQQALGKIERCASIHDRADEAIHVWLARRTTPGGPRR